jgi:hypothetical protein
LSRREALMLKLIPLTLLLIVFGAGELQAASWDGQSSQNVQQNAPHHGSNSGRISDFAARILESSRARSL